MGISEECHDITMYKIILYTLAKKKQQHQMVPPPYQFPSRHSSLKPEIVSLSVFQLYKAYESHFQLSNGLT